MHLIAIFVQRKYNLCLDSKSLIHVQIVDTQTDSQATQSPIIYTHTHTHTHPLILHLFNQLPFLKFPIPNRSFSNSQ